MKFNKKSKIKQCIKLLSDSGVDQETLNKLRKPVSIHGQSRTSLMNILIDCIMGKDIEELKLQESRLKEVASSINNENIVTIQDSIMLVHVSERLKEKPTSLNIIRWEDFIFMEERMMLDRILDANLMFIKCKRNANKHCAIGIIHHMIDHDYFTIDETDKDSSIRIIIEFLKNRWRLGYINEFYRKKNKEKYMTLASRQFPLINILEIRR